MSNAEQVLTANQMRAAEDALIAQGISVTALMERAGRGAADWVWRVAAGRAVTVLCGPGNNGGDGYVIAAALRARGLTVTVIAPLPPATGAAGAARDVWGAEVLETAPQRGGGVLVDCLFGSGLSRPLSDVHAALIASLAAQHDLTVAVDLPSGVATDDGALLGNVTSCDLTLALGAWKPAHFLMPARAVMGELRRVEIGVARMAGAAAVSRRPRLRTPARDAHKYTRGLVGVVAGALPGAALLASEAAMRSGAGYVKLLSEGRVDGAPAALVIDRQPVADALSDRRWSALLVGPGLGRDADARARLSAVLERRLPTVLDADALHLLDDDALEGLDTTRLLVTPHPGELAVLCQSFGIAASGKVDSARNLAELTGLTVLAKGPDTVLAEADGRLTFFLPASSWLSTAGTGDVLAGIAAGSLAVTGNPQRAAEDAVWVHGEAARIAGDAFTADDLAHAVSTAYHRFL